MRIFSPRAFRMNQGAIVNAIGRDNIYIMIRHLALRRDLEQVADRLLQTCVEVDQIMKRFFIEGAKIICVIFKIRTVFISRNQGRPVQMLPTTVVADAHFAHRLPHTAVSDNRDSQFERSVGGGNAHTIAETLLFKVLAAIFDDSIASIEFGIVLYRPQV